MDILGPVVIVVAAAIYLAPSLVAWARHHHNGAPIFIVNLFLGWTGLGWVVALAWAFTQVKPDAGAPPHDRTPWK